KFLLQIGHSGRSNGSNDLENFASPTKATYYAKTNEVFVTDGYINRRVAGFDADSGKYKRHWGAYGKPPDDSAPKTRTYEGPAPQQFNLSPGAPRGRCRNRSTSHTPCRFPATAWCMSPTGRTIASRCSNRTGRL